MMRSHTKRYLDAAIDELKRDGYQILVLMLERPNVAHTCGSILLPEACDKARRECEACNGLQGMEVSCSETNNPMIVKEMAKAALEGLSQSDGDGPRASRAN